jgi:hypothetical protein
LGNPDFNDTRRANAAKLLETVNALMAELETAGVRFQVNEATGSQVSGMAFGGFRPQSCAQGAIHSAHKEALAVDIFDPAGDIDNYLVKNPDLLVKHGVYIEEPSATVHWSHWSIKAPLSGKHIFTP